MFDVTTAVVFVVCAATAVTEILLNNFWARVYFEHGLRILRFRTTAASGLPPGIEHHLSAEASYTRGPRLEFKRLSPTTIGFRERKYRDRSRAKYAPVIHGLVRSTAAGNSAVEVVGWLNWTPLFFLAAVGIVLWVIDVGLVSYLGSLALAGLWLAIYFTQRSRYRAVANAVSTYAPREGSVVR